MTVEELSRQLGAAIQEDARYKRFVDAKDKATSDLEIVSLDSQINEIREQYSTESTKPDPDSAVLEQLDGRFQELYSKLMATEAMSVYNVARQEIDDMMNYVNQIIYLCVNGEDPATCQPKPNDGGECGGSCGTCGGCS